MKRRALISVSDKSGVLAFAKELSDLGFEVISTGGTLAALKDGGVPAVSISDVTGFPEGLDGRVKTLHPAVHAGLLAMRGKPSHMQFLEDNGLGTIDVVAVNLYPFKEAVQKPGCTLEIAVENIDIGGPTMLRSAAKNYQDVYVVVDPADYGTVLDELKSGGESKDTRFRLMVKVFQHTAVYDTLISGYLRKQLGVEFPEQITFAYEKAQDLRYGENPHQSAVFYKECFPVPGALSAARQIHGKELSYNNINDTNGALDLLRDMGNGQTCVVAVKHANPCGVGVGGSIKEAYVRAFEADPVSVFGGIIACNAEVDKATAEEMVKTFLEIIVAPAFTKDALTVLTAKKNLRLLELPTINAPLASGTYDMKKVVGGLLVQGIDDKLFDEKDWKVVTKKAPTDDQIPQLIAAYKVVKHTKSNAIALWNGNSSAGIGCGQTNRIWAMQQAIEHAGERAKGAVMGSDAFFPFSDCVEAAAKAGITAIIQPGGSVRDQDSIDACDKAGIAMVFCNMRHFKH